MKRFAAALSASALLALPLAASAALTPGMYEYTMTMNMPGMGSMPARTIQRCVSASDLSGATKGYGAPARDGSDCKMTDFSESGGKFSYKMSCTKPDKMDATVTGTATATSMSTDMTMNMKGGTMTQSTTAKRIGDCK
jgi:hypothetical protein